MRSGKKIDDARQIANGRPALMVTTLQRRMCCARVEWANIVWECVGDSDSLSLSIRITIHVETL